MSRGWISKAKEKGEENQRPFDAFDINACKRFTTTTTFKTYLDHNFWQSFFSFVIYYDDVNLKVVEIIDFRKKFPKGMVNAFYVI